jgi:hypothetical protein
VVFKFTAKVYATRMSPVAHRIIALSQTAFTKGWIIIDGALSLHEIIHELKAMKIEVVLLNLNIENAYDRVS